MIDAATRVRVVQQDNDREVCMIRMGLNRFAAGAIAVVTATVMTGVRWG
jgi:hypothetical protein